MAYGFKVGQRVEIRDWANGGRAALATIATRSTLRTMSNGQREPDGGPFYTLDGFASPRADGAYREAELKAPDVLPILLRAERSGPFKGSVSVVFPTIPADYYGREVTVYGDEEHGGGSWAWLHERTRPAKPAEYADNLASARRIYESAVTDGDPVFLLQIVQRRTDAHRKAFDSEVRRSLDSLKANPAGAPWTPAQ